MHRINQTVCWSMLSSAYRHYTDRVSNRTVDKPICEPTFLNPSSMPIIPHLYQQITSVDIPTLHSSIVPEWKKDAFRVHCKIEALLQSLWGIIHNPKLNREIEKDVNPVIWTIAAVAYALQGAFGFVLALTRVVNSKCPSSFPSGRSRSVNSSLYSSCARSDSCWQ